MTKTTLISSLILLTLLSCGPSYEELSYTDFTRTDFPDSQVLKSDTIPQNDPLNPTSFYVIRDSIVVTLDIKASFGHFLEFYDIRTHKILNKALSKGSGPGEVLSCRFFYDRYQDKLFVHDYIGYKYGEYDIETLLSEGLDYKPEVQKLPADAENVSPLVKDSLIGYNSMYMEYKEISNGVEELFKLKLPYDTAFKIVTGNEKYFSPNVNGAYLLVSPDKDRLIVPNYYQDVFTIYDKNLDFVNRFRGPDQIEPQYATRDGRHISFSPGLYYRAYYPSVFTKEHVYLLYVGANGISSDLDQLDKKPTEVFKIDWDGNLISHFEMNEFLINISINSQEDVLYGTTWNSDGSPPRLVSYNLIKP